MSKLKRLTMATLSASILLTQGGPLPYLAYAVDSVNKAPINGEVNFSWTTADQVTVGSTFNPYAGLEVIDADGDNVAVLANVEGEVDTSRVGVYPITYSIENVDGEVYTMTRQVEVVVSEQDSDETVVSPSNMQIDEGEQETAIESEENSTEGVETVPDITQGTETAPDEELGENTLSHPLNDVSWVLYNRSDKEELVKFKVNVETGKYEIYLVTNLDETLVSLDDERLNEKILELRIFSSQQVEKLSLSLTLKDLLTESDEVKELMELSYELGDQVNVIPLIKEKNVLVVNGVTGGDISIEQEDYSEGVESEDLIHNVRFVLDEAGLLTLYNEAPVIEGIEDIEVSDIESFDPKEGVTVKDDHDDNLLQQLTSTMEQLDEGIYQVTYQVTDSWGRTTEAVRQVVEVKELENSINPLTDDESTPTTTIADNSIIVKGIEFNDVGDERFKIIFDPKKRIIQVVDQDGVTMDSRVKETYFVLTHYSATGEVKNKVELLGTDRSNSPKLNELKNSGWRYAEGDYISIWHADAETKLVIEGSVQDATNDKITDINANFLRLNRFELNSTGLKLITNTAPMITLSTDAEKDITIKRGDSVDILEGLTISDDHTATKDLDFEISEYSTTEVGNQEVTITVIDSWGESTEYTRTLIVEPKNDIDGMKINVKNKSGEVVFTLGFDELTKKLTVTNQSNIAIDSNNSSEVLIIRIYSKAGKTKRTIRIKGTDLGNSSVINAINNYTYSKDDYISIVPVDSSIVSITGTITSQTDEGVVLNEFDDLTDLDKLVNARFQLKSAGTVIYNYNHAPTFSGIDPINVVRGDDFDPLLGVSVMDQEDGSIDQSNIVVKYNQEALNTLGKTTVTYTVTDSWGRTTTVEREVTVIAPNNREYYKFYLLNEDNQPFFSIAFDEINNHLMVDSYISKDYIDGNSADEVFKITLYNSDHQVKGSASLNYQQEISDSFLTQISNLNLEIGDYITVFSPDYEKVVVTYQSGDNPAEINTFDTEDQIRYTRFDVLEDSLYMVYNQAPKIIGADDVKIVYGNSFDLKKDVSVDDEETLEFTISGNSNVIDKDDNFIATEIGTYQVTYSVTDSYGRTTEQTRTVEIVPVYTTNEVQYIDENNQYLVSIGINESATGFTGTITDLSNSSTKSQDEIVTQNGNLDVPNDTLFKFTVYDTTGNTISVLEITESTTIDEHLFDELKSLIVRPGYRFSIESKDLTKVKVTGRLEKDEQVKNVDYANLTAADKDSVDNVRFELTENIVKAIYNQAPVITIEPTPTDEGDSTRTNASTDIIRKKALTKESYNLLEGVSVEDDKDELTLTVENVEVDDDMLVSELEESVQTIGKTYMVTYHVEDSWGRESNPVTRQVTIKSAMDDISLDFIYADTDFVLNMDNKAMTVTFNMSESKLIATAGNIDKFKVNSIEYGAFGILPKDSTGLSLKLILGGQNTYDKDTEFSDAYSANNVSTIIEKISENNSINYGDKIKIKMYQSPMLFIYGTVLDAQENYSQGAWLGSILADSYFVVTPEGLKQEYTELTPNENNFTEIDWYSGVAGNRAISLQLDNTDPNNMKIIATQHDTENYLSTVDKDGQDILTWELHTVNGNVFGGTYNGRSSLTTVINQFNNRPVQEGDYFVIKPLKDRYLTNIKLYNVNQKRYFSTEVDYSGVITENTYFDDVRFYITKSGIVPVYNNGPIFNGADDIDIIVGSSNGTFDTKEGVTVTDEIDGEQQTLTLEYKVSQDTVDISVVGTYEITYTATDSWGRETTHTRTVNVRPQLFDNKIQVFASNNTTNLAFEVIFDNQKTGQLVEDVRTNSSILGGLVVKSYSDESLDLNLATTDVFKIWVLDAEGKEKISVTLQGRDTATSSKLKELEKVQYEEGDIIKVWRHPGLDNESGEIQTLKITGTVANDSDSKTSDDYSNGFENLDQMNNTVFAISDDGLTAFYNEAPQLEGVTDQTIYYGETFNPYKGISVTDDRDSLTLKAVQVTHNVDTNRIGEYTVTYNVTDCWGRTTAQTITVKVLSKVVNNTIEIYSDESTKSFTIGFNEQANRLVVSSDSSDNGNGDYSLLEMTLIIYDRFGTKKADISITSEDTEQTVTEKLKELTAITIATNDMIAISHTTSNLIKIQGDVVDSSEDYSNGFSSTEVMKEVRFQVTNNGLKEIKSQNYTIEFDTESLVIKRGEEYDLLKDITVDHPTETISSYQVEVIGFDINQIGKQTITYTVTDSWGKEVSKVRDVTVEPANELETFKIHLMDESGQIQKFTIGFDTVEMKLTAKLPNQSLISRLFKSLPIEGTIFEVNVYDQNHGLQNSFELTANDLTGSSSIINQIKEESIEYGYFIEVRAYDYDKGLTFEGQITMESDEDDMDHSDFTTMSKKEFITNARFEVTEDGLVALYNEAPVITGVEEQEIYIGEETDFREVLEVSDDHDDLTNEDIEVTSDNFNLYEPGYYNVTYTLTDSWGRSTEIKSNIWVLSELQQSVITLKSKNSSENRSNGETDNNLNWMVKLGFNSKTQQLAVQFNENNNEQLDSTNPDRTFVVLTIFDEDGQEVTSINLQGSDNITSIQSKLAKYVNYKYTYGHWINIDIFDDTTNQITIDNFVSLSEDIPQMAYQATSETNKEYFTNVRFELDYFGLQAIYNHAPEIENTDGDLLTYVKSRDVEDYDLLGSLKITDEDDYDKGLTTETNIKVYYNKDKEDITDPENPENLQLGDNTITYVGVDSWGRESNQITRHLTLTSGMNEVAIEFGQTYDSDGSNDKIAMRLEFDMDSKEMKAIAVDDYGNNNFKFNGYYSYTFQLYVPESSNDTITYSYKYGAYYGTIGWEESIKSEISDASTFTGTRYIDKAVEGIANLEIELEYGMVIRVRSFQAPFLFIQGPVINAQEDYSLGAQINSILNDSYFILTPEGLEQIYKQTVIPSANENIITWYSGIAGEKQVELKINPATLKFSVETFNEGEPLDTHNKTSDAFKITQYSANGTVKKSVTYTGAKKPTDVASDWNDEPFVIGDYLEIELPERRQANLRIYGDIREGNSTSQVDFSSIIPDVSYYNESRFYITEDGLSLDYNEAPQFEGIIDEILYLNEEPLILTDGITVTDDHDENLEYKVVNETNITLENYDNVVDIKDSPFVPDNTGAYQVNYITKDSRNRITVEPRFIWVYGRSEITVDTSQLIIQEADPKLRTADAVYQYLIDMVIVTDVEDDAAGNPIEVTKDNIETNLNPMKPGEYNVTYTVTDSDGNVSRETFTITVVRSISVSVPRNNIPFQVVTNLLGETTEGQEFISGTIKVVNEYVTDVKVSVQSLVVSTENDSLQKDGTFELVEPYSVNWETLSEEETMTKMALGLYAKSGIESIDTITPPTKDSPIWLTTNMQKQAIGLLPKGTLPSVSTQADDTDTSTVITPSEAVLSFTAKYGKNFTSGKHRMQFTMVLEFE